MIAKIQKMNHVLVFFVFFVMIVMSIKVFDIPHREIIFPTVFMSPLLAIHGWMTLSQFRLLASIHPSRRQVPPFAVFLSLIPFIGQVWNFFLVERTKRSFENEFNFRGIELSEGEFGRSNGKSWALMLALIAIFVSSEMLFYILFEFSLLLTIIVIASIAINAWSAGLSYSQYLNRLRRYLKSRGMAFESQDQRDFDDEEP